MREIPFTGNASSNLNIQMSWSLTSY